MIYPEELVNLFKKHGYWKTSLFVFVIMCVSLVMAIVFTCGIALVNAVWCFASIYGNYVICMEKEEHLATKEKLADAEDKLCISRHDVERLVIELETAHAALEEMQKPKNYSGYVQTGLAQVASIDTQRPKLRKPAPRGTRKPKTEKKNENNMD